MVAGVVVGGVYVFYFAGVLGLVLIDLGLVVCGKVFFISCKFCVVFCYVGGFCIYLIINVDFEA